MTLQNTFRMHGIWSVLLLVLYFHSFQLTGSLWSAFMLFIAITNFAASIFALRQHRWAIVISILMAVFMLIRWTPMVIINFKMVYDGDPLYTDSPATAFIVMLYAIFFVIPAFLLCCRYLFCFRELQVALKKQNVGDVSESSEK